MSERLTTAQSPYPTAEKACGHSDHVGTCSNCQRAQLDRWSLQLAEVQRLQASLRG
jgi:hypothetical protein